MQHFVEVYWREFQILRFFSYANSAAALLCPAPLGCSPTGRFSWGRIVVIAHSCFRSSRAARNLADHRNKLSHPWPFCWGASSKRDSASRETRVGDRLWSSEQRQFRSGP